jgi:aryl-alcohol dehydrogenase-like predicted oxidoreductase
MQGEEKKALEIIRRALEKGMAFDDIADLTGYDAAAIEGYQKDWFADKRGAT